MVNEKEEIAHLAWHFPFLLQALLSSQGDKTSYQRRVEGYS